MTLIRLMLDNSEYLLLRKETEDASMPTKSGRNKSSIFQDFDNTYVDLNAIHKFFRTPKQKTPIATPSEFSRSIVLVSNL